MIHQLDLIPIGSGVQDCCAAFPARGRGPGEGGGAVAAGGGCCHHCRQLGVALRPPPLALHHRSHSLQHGQIRQRGAVPTGGKNPLSLQRLEEDRIILDPEADSLVYIKRQIQEYLNMYPVPVVTY